MKKIGYSFKELDLFNLTFISSIPLIGVVLLILHIWFEGFNPYLLIPAVIMYILTGFSITGGYHRLFAHRSYQANPVIKLFYLLFGAAAGENSVLKWATDHRIHHQNVDTDGDPYDINQGFFYAHVGWIIRNQNLSNANYPKDLTNDKLVMWQDRNLLPITVLVNVIPCLIIGFLTGSWLGSFAIVGFLRVAGVQHATFFINSLCHMLGKRPYDDSQTARDSFFLALLTFGEGYHNFHHTFQLDYRNGIRWYQWDPTKWAVNLMSRVGLASNLKRTSELSILKAKMNVLANKYNHSHDHKMTLEELSLQVQVALKKLDDLKKEYQLKKKQKAEEFHLQLEELKAKIQQAKTEFQELYAQWEMGLLNMQLVTNHAT